MVKIGLEIHGYILTKEKLFCSCKAEHGLKNSKPNKNICPICTGQPGAKPMLPNKVAVDKSIQIALVLGCKINEKPIWQRKHYNWPDLPKGYQNTLSGPYAVPIGEKGKFLKIKITEAHLEEDPAAWNPKTGEIDYNRSGSPLIEIVTDPDFKNAEEVINWLKNLLASLNYIKAIDKKSGIKADVNISTKGERVEIKNINSLRNIRAAIEYEIERQKKEKVKSKETRMFDQTENITKKMRSKEEAQNYRFISDPDLPTVIIKKDYVKKIKNSLPETPQEKLKKLIKKYNLNTNYAEILTKKIDIAEFFESIIEKTNPKLAVRWVIGELLRILNYSKKELDEVEINPIHFIELLNLIEQKKITELKGKEILNDFIPKSFSPRKNLIEHAKISGKQDITKICKEIIKKTPQAVKDYKKGKQKALNFLIGQIMKKTKKRADYSIIKEILKKELK